MGKSSHNPTDVYRRAQKKKELRKNKSQRLLARDAKVVATQTVAGTAAEVQVLEQKQSNKNGYLDGIDTKKLERLRKELRMVREAAEAEVKKREEEEERLKKMGKVREAEAVRTDWQQEKRGIHPAEEYLKENPKTSVYYDVRMNPFGAAPPGKPLLFHLDEVGGVTMNYRRAVVLKRLVEEEKQEEEGQKKKKKRKRWDVSETNEEAEVTADETEVEPPTVCEIDTKEEQTAVPAPPNLNKPQMPSFPGPPPMFPTGGPPPPLGPPPMFLVGPPPPPGTGPPPPHASVPPFPPPMFNGPPASAPRSFPPAFGNPGPPFVPPPDRNRAPPPQFAPPPPPLPPPPLPPPLPQENLPVLPPPSAAMKRGKTSKHLKCDIWASTEEEKCYDREQDAELAAQQQHERQQQQKRYRRQKQQPSSSDPCCPSKDGYADYRADVVQPIMPSIKMKNPSNPNTNPCHLPLVNRWYYRDQLSGALQGPFDTHQMMSWKQSGFFPPSTPLRNGEHSNAKFNPMGSIDLSAALRPQPPPPSQIASISPLAKDGLVLQQNTEEGIEARIAALRGERHQQQSEIRPALQQSPLSNDEKVEKDKCSADSVVAVQQMQQSTTNITSDIKALPSTTTCSNTTNDDTNASSGKGRETFAQHQELPQENVSASNNIATLNEVAPLPDQNNAAASTDVMTLDSEEITPTLNDRNTTNQEYDHISNSAAHNNLQSDGKDLAYPTDLTYPAPNDECFSYPNTDHAYSDETISNINDVATAVPYPTDLAYHADLSYPSTSSDVPMYPISSLDAAAAVSSSSSISAIPLFPPPMPQQPKKKEYTGDKALVGFVPSHLQVRRKPHINWLQ
mmetsp:Transcript_39418/g.47405  ORF Transcript_39418/g.47405 Transcript_39418/m.47405 type:complete len:846 (-) Transcript_39418:217-2754(-)